MPPGTRGPGSEPLLLQDLDLDGLAAEHVSTLPLSHPEKQRAPPFRAAPRSESTFLYPAFELSQKTGRARGPPLGMMLRGYCLVSWKSTRFSSNCLSDTEAVAGAV